MKYVGLAEIRIRPRLRPTFAFGTHFHCLSVVWAEPDVLLEPDTGTRQREGTTELIIATRELLVKRTDRSGIKYHLCFAEEHLFIIFFY